MPSLQIRDLPEHIYHKLRDEARKQHRSLSQQAVFVLSQGLQTSHDPKQRRKELISKIQSGPLHTQSTQLKDPVEMIRQDRER